MERSGLDRNDDLDECVKLYSGQLYGLEHLSGDDFKTAVYAAAEWAWFGTEPDLEPHTPAWNAYRSLRGKFLDSWRNTLGNRNKKQRQRQKDRVPEPGAETIDDKTPHPTTSDKHVVGEGGSAAVAAAHRPVRRNLRGEIIDGA